MSFADDLKRRVVYRASVIAGQARGDLESTLKRQAPVGKPSPYRTHEPGQLRDSIAVNVRYDQAGIFTFHAECPVPYAIFTDKGAGPHPIVGVNSPHRVLRFDFPRAGLTPAFFRRISHPGSSGTHWFSDTIQQWPDILRGAAG